MIGHKEVIQHIISENWFKHIPLQNHKETPINYLEIGTYYGCLLYTSPSPRDRQKSRMPSSA